MAKLETDEKIYLASYAAEGGYNAIMEIKATKEGLEIDEHTIVPWDWVKRVGLLEGRLEKSDTPPPAVSRTPEA